MNIKAALGPPFALYSSPPFRSDLAKSSPAPRGIRVFGTTSSRLFAWFGLVLSQSDFPYLIYISWIIIPRAEYYIKSLSNTYRTFQTIIQQEKVTRSWLFTLQIAIYITYISRHTSSQPIISRVYQRLLYLLTNEIAHQGIWIFSWLSKSHHLTLKMAPAQIAESSIANNSPSQDSSHSVQMTIFNQGYATPEFKPCSYKPCMFAYGKGFVSCAVFLAYWVDC